MSNVSTHYVITPQGYVSITQVCKDLGLSRPTINRWIKKISQIEKLVVNEVHYISIADVDKIKEARSSG